MQTAVMTARPQGIEQGQALLSVEALTAGYGESQVIGGASISIPAGSAVCLLGRNGVGKTTLLKSIMGLIRPRSGRVLVDGHDLTSRGPHERARLGVGYIPQGRGMFPHLTVLDNLYMGFEARPRATAAERAATLAEIYGLFPVLGEMRGRIAGALSGGQQQQLAIGRALVGRPRMLLLDEPTEGIQPSIVEQIEAVLSDLHARGMTLLLVEQFVDFAVSVCDHYLVLERGTIVSEGATRDLRQEVIEEYLAV